MQNHLYLLIVLLIISCKSDTKTSTEHNTTISHIYLVRHAEKDISDTKNLNPELTPKGIARAKKLSTLLNSVGIEAVYATAYHRTLQTAKPTALQNNLKIITCTPKSLNIKRLLSSNKNTLIVGHSNTIPTTVNSLINNKVFNTIEENNFGNLYHITITNGQVSNYKLSKY